MAATTVTLSTAKSLTAPRTHIGLTPVDITTELATTSLDTAADTVNLFQFPANAHLWSPMYVDVDDLDSGGAPALVWDLNVVDSDNTSNSVTLINNSTVGQSAGTDVSDAEQTDLLRSVANQYLEFQVVTAAQTAAAGTFRVRFAYFAGFGGQLTGT